MGKKKIKIDDPDVASFISTFWDAYKAAEPFVDKLEDFLREEFRKSNPGPQALFAILGMFSGRLMAIFRNVLQMKDKDIQEAYYTVFQICYNTYAKVQDDKLKALKLSWDDVADKIEELEKNIRINGVAIKAIKERMNDDPVRYKTEEQLKHLELLEKELELNKQIKALLERNFPCEFN